MELECTAVLKTNIQENDATVGRLETEPSLWQCMQQSGHMEQGAQKWTWRHKIVADTALTKVFDLLQRQLFSVTSILTCIQCCSMR